MRDSHGDLCEGRVLRLCHCMAIMYFTFHPWLSPSHACILKQDLQCGSPPSFDGTSSQGHLLLAMSLISSEAIRTLFLLSFPSSSANKLMLNATEKPLRIMMDPMRVQRRRDLVQDRLTEMEL